MKISILSHNLSGNSLGRAYLLAKILQKKYEVEIIGPVGNEGIWNPLKNDKTIRYKIIKDIFNLSEITSLIDGEIIYAIKPNGTSFGYALLKKLKSKKALILDIDDWEFAWYLNNKSSMIKSGLVFWNLNNSLYTFLLEMFVKYADGITVSSHFLKNKFGGTIIPHVRDTDLFNPKRYDPKKIRKELGFNKEKIILFLGTIRKHKGIDDLMSAIELLNEDKIKLILVGVDFNDFEVKSLISYKKKYTRFYGFLPFKEIPKFISIADLVVLPQKKNKYSQAQVPAKIFDAMAMAKPIIATNISDLPKILKGCGIIVEPGDTRDLAEKIEWVLDNPKEAKILGKKAREKCIKEYSFDAVAPKLFKIFEKYNINKKDAI